MLENDSNFKHINVADVENGLATKAHVILDIRDANSFAISHIPGALHLSNDGLADFLREADFDAPTVVCCYHGISSQQAAQFLIGHDFTDVYSLDGGFELWASSYPQNIEKA